jgi:RNA recognition motif-containing protein
MKLFVAKLNRDVQDEHLVEAFSAHGEVAYARVITDRETGQSKCFGFVQMRDAQGGQAAIEAMNGAELMGFRMVVKEAEERPRPGAPRPGAPRPGGAPTGGRPSDGGVRPRSPRSEDGAEFSRHTGGDDSSSKDFRKKAAPKKSKPKGQRDIYADGPKPSKLKKSKPKNTDWLDDLDDF